MSGNWNIVAQNDQCLLLYDNFEIDMILMKINPGRTSY